ncbi:MAG: archaellin/type IV pilin N-terminal domain-containing protein [Thermofilum sp.]
MRRKGISPVIATLLLIVIAVVAAVLTYIWVTGYMGTLSPREVPGQLRERIKIDAVSIGTSDVTIYFSNIGESTVNIAGAYVLYENFTVVPNCANTTNLLPSNVAPGATDQVQIQGCTLQADRTYIAKVTTREGVEATYIFRR